MEFLHSILDVFSNLQPWHYLVIVVLGYFIENFFPPIPGDTFLVFSAYIYGISNYQAHLPWLYAASIVGAVSGYMLMVVLGRRLGRSYFEKKDLKYAKASFFSQVESSFARYGDWVVAGNRLFFGLRPVIGLFTGISRIRLPRTLLMVTLSAVVFNALFLVLGYYIGENWPLVESILQKYTVLTLIITAVLCGIFVWRKWIRRKNKHTETD